MSTSRSTLNHTNISHHGWDAFLIGNGLVEAVIVPAVNRIMQFRFVGGPDVFWENRRMDGKLPDAASDRWCNFGGDKAWPAPQSDWQKATGRDWPPPVGFDATPAEAGIADDTVILTSAVDPDYGIRVARTIALQPGQPRMTVTTEYQKVSGGPARVGVWIVTQLRDPQRAFMVHNGSSRLPGGYVQIKPDPPMGLDLRDGLVSLTRAHYHEAQIASDASDLLWMDQETALLIHSPRTEGEYPNRGSSAVIFTAKDPFPYVELETFGPLQVLEAGALVRNTNSYTLFRRSESDVFAEARKLSRV
jgi:hypothetical protein